MKTIPSRSIDAIALATMILLGIGALSAPLVSQTPSLSLNSYLAIVALLFGLALLQEAARRPIHHSVPRSGG
ncbi:MAG: hypothetical protein EA425_12485 [Puniceicoccaceae bacterium]|nr:MAG: hypothetical protein EA425_12485 [Puniceicoccaceae bacterium]